MKKNILVMGEKDDFRALMKAVLSDDYSLYDAASSEKAVQVLKSHPIHLIISSLGIQNEYAVNFVSSLRETDNNTSGVSVALLTRGFSAELLAAAEEYKIDLLNIPFEPIEFLNSVNAVIIKNAKNYEKPDPLTGLHKKQYAEEQIKELLLEGKKGALLLINVDRFSFASSTVSNEIILSCRDVLKNMIDIDTVLAAPNKHSFILFVPNLRDRKEIERYGAGIIEKFGDELKNEKVYVSIGLAVTDRHGNDYDDLYQHCDLGLSRARNMGKNIACFYSW